MPFAAADTLLILPELFLTAAGLVLLLAATVGGRAKERAVALAAIASLVVTGLLIAVSVSSAKSLGQEYGPDPDVPTVIDVPRVSSEHFIDNDSAREIFDALAAPGIFAHFIHPDDIFDPQRSLGRTFDEMMKSLDDLVTRVDTAYPFLKARTASEAAADIRSFDRARLEATRGPKGLLLRAVDPPPFGLLVFVRTPRGAGVRIGSSCETVSSIPADGRHYLRIGNTACSITWD